MPGGGGDFAYLKEQAEALSATWCGLVFLVALPNGPLLGNHKLESTSEMSLYTRVYNVVSA